MADAGRRKKHKKHNKNNKNSIKKKQVIVLLVIAAILVGVIVFLALRLAGGGTDSRVSEESVKDENARTGQPQPAEDGSASTGNSGEGEAVSTQTKSAKAGENSAGSREQDENSTGSREQDENSAGSGEQDGNSTGIPETDNRETMPAGPAPVTQISPDLIRSLYGFMLRRSDGGIALDKNSEDIIFPASMTKVMTALVAIEQLPDLDEQIVITPEILSPLYEAGASLAGFEAGESVSVRDLLYGVLLPSGAEACIALAQRIAGSEEGFVALMNEKAAELGLTDTHFVNCTGLHDDGHYTTCRDTAKMFEAALNNDTFYQIITSDTYTCAPNSYHPEGLTMYGTMFSYLGNPLMDNGALILGGKTGTTDEAGYCLVSFGRYRDEEYILVTALGQYSEEEERANIADARTAYGNLQ